jgi:hypothetical protein
MLLEDCSCRREAADKFTFTVYSPTNSDLSYASLEFLFAFAQLVASRALILNNRRTTWTSETEDDASRWMYSLERVIALITRKKADITDEKARANRFTLLFFAALGSTSSCFPRWCRCSQLLISRCSATLL